MAANKLLVPVDYSQDSRLALDYALMLATRLGASIHIVHVWECMPRAPKDLKVSMPDGGSRSLNDLIEENAEKEFTAFLAGVELPPGLAVDHSIQSGEPSRRILETAQAGGCSLIVMGSRGRGALQHLALGSVAERVARLSPVPVLIVPMKR